MLEYDSKPAFYESWSQFGAYYTEANLQATLNSISNLNLTAFHKHFCIIIDGGWAAPTRDSAGKLAFDSAKFPSGTNILNLIHAYGCKALLWVEEGGEVTTPTTGTPSTSGENIENDALTIAGWGFDGAKFDLTSSGYDAQKKIDQVTRFITAFRSVATNRQTFFYHDVGLGLGRNQFLDFPPGAVICENSENDPGDILHWTATMLTHLSNVNGRNHWNCGREVYEGWSYGPSFIKVWSMLGSPYVFSSVYHAEYYSHRALYTKQECIALNNDPLFQAPTLLFHTLTNLGLARLRMNGTLTALAFNTTTNQTQHLSFQFSQLGLPAGYAVDIRDIYNEVDRGQFSNSFSFTLGPMEAILLTFDSEGRRPLLNVAQPMIGGMRINIYGRPNHEIILQRSTNLVAWFPVATNTLDANPWSYSTLRDELGAVQFLRAIRP